MTEQPTPAPIRSDIVHVQLSIELSDVGADTQIVHNDGVYSDKEIGKRLKEIGKHFDKLDREGGRDQTKAKKK